jgi:drug/metabolite transporter (DMT)-like permease
MGSGFALSVALAALGAVLFSAKAIVVKLSYVYGADASTVLALRMIASLPFFWAAVWWEGRRTTRPPIARKDFWQLLFLGFIGYYISSYLDFLGLQYISAGLERVILYLNPTMVLVLSAVLLKKKISSRQWLAMAIAYIGVLLVFLQDVRWEGSQATLGSTFVYLIFSGEVVSRVGSIRVVAFASASSTVFAILHALIMNPAALITQPNEVYWLALLNGSLCTFVPMLAIMVAIHRVGSGLAAQAGVAGPIATVFLGWYFLAEPISVMQLVGIAIVLIGMAVLLTSNRPASESQ